MRQNIWCLLFLIVCLAAVLVKSQTFSEVDEDGNEIEVKRFYIEGRQLNGGRRQCVETRRRKRAYNYGQSDDNANDELPIASGTAATGIDTAVSLDEEDAAKEDEEAIDNDNNANEEQMMAEHKEEQMKEDEADDERKEEAVLSLPVIAQITHSNGGQSSVGAAAAGDNGIVIVHTNKPPKVNPQTHAVFELRPVQSDVNDNVDNDEYDEYDGDDDDNSNFIYHEEISPVSTTAIWSTGEDDLGNLYDDYKDNNGEDNEEGDEAAVKPKPKPKPPKKKPSKRPTNRSSKKPSKKKNKKNKNKKNKNKNKKPSNNKHRRPGNKNKHMPGKRGMGNNKRRRPNNGQYNSRRGQLNNLHAHNQGTRTFTKTATFTRTGTADEDRDVNCIIINKTTTPRPFWGLLGRSADGEAVAPADRPYGRRKRINFSIHTSLNLFDIERERKITTSSVNSKDE